MNFVLAASTPYYEQMNCKKQIVRVDPFSSTPLYKEYYLTVKRETFFLP